MCFVTLRTQHGIKKITIKQYFSWLLFYFIFFHTFDINLNITFVSSQCKRVSVNTSKKGTNKLKCRHEVIVSLMCGVTDETLQTAEKTCSNCLKTYTQTGGECKFCTNTATYCTRKCQVKVTLCYKSNAQTVLII